MSEGLYSIDVEVVGQTEKAIRVTDGTKTWWVPQSLVHDDSEVWELGQTGALVVPEWFAIKEGMA